MQKSTFSVNFLIRRTRLGKSGETPIMMRISVDGRYTELSTQRRVPVEQWSQSRCCATGKTAVALVVVLAITVGLVTLRSWRAATENPADVVKNN